MVRVRDLADGGPKAPAAPKQAVIQLLQLEAFLGGDASAAEAHRVEPANGVGPPGRTVNGGKSMLIAAPPCIIAKVPTRTNWWTRQFPEMKARSPTTTWPPSSAPLARMM